MIGATTPVGDRMSRTLLRTMTVQVGAFMLACTALHAQAVSAAAPAGRGGLPPYTAADVFFMQHMIGHHAQAIVMAGWAPSHGASEQVQVLAGRIVVSQQDEIASMQRWLRDHHEMVPDASGHMQMDMGPGTHDMLMPGMLTADQLAELDRARGPAFDRLFLMDMVRHHGGALDMVHDLMESQGAAQDEVIFKFASDVSADQTAEIDRMMTLLRTMPADSTH
jgi:uncharacterized protein (DUF305 family)